MSSPYIGEIRMFGGSFNPAGWAMCDGQLMPISQNETLFNLIGTTYGGDGEETFALPDMQGRIPLHFGTSSEGITYQIGEKAGVETVTLTMNTTPVHNHAVLASTNNALSGDPTANILASSGQVKMYTPFPPALAMSSNALTSVGGGQPHENMAPFLAVTFIISLFGIFPSQN